MIIISSSAADSSLYHCIFQWCLQAEAEQRAREAASASKLAPVEEREEPAVEQSAEQSAAEVGVSP